MREAEPTLNREAGGGPAYFVPPQQVATEPYGSQLQRLGEGYTYSEPPSWESFVVRPEEDAFDFNSPLAPSSLGSRQGIEPGLDAAGSSSAGPRRDGEGEWASEAHGECPIMGTHRHEPDGGIYFPNLATVLDTWQLMDLVTRDGAAPFAFEGAEPGNAGDRLFAGAGPFASEGYAPSTGAALPTLPPRPAPSTPVWYGATAGRSLFPAEHPLTPVEPAPLDPSFADLVGGNVDTASPRGAAHQEPTGFQGPPPVDFNFDVDVPVPEFDGMAAALALAPVAPATAAAAAPPAIASPRLFTSPSAASLARAALDSAAAAGPAPALAPAGAAADDDDDDDDATISPLRTYLSPPAASLARAAPSRDASTPNQGGEEL